MVLAPHRGDVDMGLRQLQVHLVHGIRDDLGDGEIAEPFVVGRNDVPWRVLRARPLHRFLERCDVVGPQGALGVVALADLPLPPGVLQPCFEALELLFGADV